MTNIKKIGVLTSGGDSPGMNAAVRAIVRSGIHYKLDVFGIYRGYQGMIEGEIKQLTSDDVSNIIQKGGTIIKTARCMEFMEYEGRKKAYEQLKKFGIDAFIVIGGDGSFRGASQMIGEFKDLSVIGLPGTIDNDIYGTEYTIGYDTALNTAVEAVDKIKDTAYSHDRVFFVEVMGKEAGFLALNTGIASGAEGVLIPEVKEQAKKVIEYLKAQTVSKSHIFIVAEGDEEGNAIEIMNKVKQELPNLSMRATILGHIQRGGAPSCYDRVSATRLGVAAVEALIAGKKDIMIGLMNDELSEFPLNKTVKMHREVSDEFVKLADILKK